MAYVDRKRTARDLVHRKNRPEKKQTREEQSDPLANIWDGLAAALTIPGTRSAPDVDVQADVTDSATAEDSHQQQLEQQRYEQELRLVEVRKQQAEEEGRRAQHVAHAEERVREAAVEVSKVQQELQAATLQAEQDKHDFERVLEELTSRRAELDERLVSLREHQATKHHEHSELAQGFQQQIQSHQFALTELESELETTQSGAASEARLTQQHEAELAELDERKQLLETQVQQARASIVSKQEERQTLSDRIGELQTTIQSHQQQLQSINTDIDTSENERLQAEVQKLEASAARAAEEFETKNQAAVTQRQAEDERRAVLEKTRDEASKQIAALRGKLDQLELPTNAAEREQEIAAEITTMRADLQRLKLAVAEARSDQAKLARIQQQLDEHFSVKSQLQQELTQSQQELVKLQSETSVADRADELHQLKSNTAEIREALRESSQRLETERSVAEQQHDQLDREIAVTRQTLGELQAQLKENKAQYDAATEQLRQDLESKQQSVDHLRSEVVTAREELGAIQLPDADLVTKLETEAVGLRRELAETLDATESLQQQYQQATHQVSAAQQQHDQLHSMVHAAREELESIQLPEPDHVARLNAGVAQLSRELEETQEATRTRQQQQEQTTRQIREAQEEHERLGAVVTTAREQLSLLQSKPLPVLSESLTAELTNLQSQKAQLLDAIRTTREQVETRTQLRQKEVAEHTAEVQQLRAEIDSSQEQLRQIRSDAEAVDSELSQRIVDLSSQKTSLIESIGKAQQELDASRIGDGKRAQQLHAERTQLESEVELEKTKLEQLRASVRTAQLEAEEFDTSSLLAAKTSLQEEANSVQIELNQVKHAHEEEVKRRTAVEENVCRLTTAVDARKAELESVRQSLESLRSRPIAEEEPETLRIEEQATREQIEEANELLRVALDEEPKTEPVKVTESSFGIGFVDVDQEPDTGDLLDQVDGSFFEEMDATADTVDSDIEFNSEAFDDPAAGSIHAEARAIVDEMDIAADSSGEFFAKPAISPAAKSRLKPTRTEPEPQAEQEYDELEEVPKKRKSRSKKSRPDSLGGRITLAVGLWLMAVSAVTISAGCALYLLPGESESAVSAFAKFLEIARWLVPAAGIAGVVLLAATPKASEGRGEWRGCIVSIGALCAAWWFAPPEDLPGWLVLVIFACGIGLAIALASLLTSLSEYFEFSTLAKQCDRLLSACMGAALILLGTLACRAIELPAGVQEWIRLGESFVLGVMALWLAILALRVGLQLYRAKHRSAMTG